VSAHRSDLGRRPIGYLRPKSAEVADRGDQVGVGGHDERRDQDPKARRMALIPAGFPAVAQLPCSTF
jgi:hypothetical protein